MSFRTGTQLPGQMQTDTGLTGAILRELIGPMRLAITHTDRPGNSAFDLSNHAHSDPALIPTPFSFHYSVRTYIAYTGSW